MVMAAKPTAQPMRSCLHLDGMLTDGVHSTSLRGTGVSSRQVHTVLASGRRQVRACRWRKQLSI